MLALYEGLNEPGVPVAGGATSRSERIMLSVTALGRSARVPGWAGAKAGDTLRRHRPARGRGSCVPGRAVSRVLRSGRGGPGARRTRARDARRLGWARRRRRAPGWSVRSPVRDRSRAGPAGRGATVEDLGFGEDFECHSLRSRTPGTLRGDRGLRGGGRRRTPAGRASRTTFGGGITSAPSRRSRSRRPRLEPGPPGLLVLRSGARADHALARLATFEEDRRRDREHAEP